MLRNTANLSDYDAELFSAMERERQRQEHHIELIASETTPACA